MKFLSCFTACIVTTILLGQETSPSQKKIQIEALEISSATFWSRASNFNFQEMGLLAANNDFSDLNFDGFTKSQSCCDFQHNSINFGLNLRLNKGTNNALLGNPVLRLGLSYNYGFYSSVRFEKRETFTFDTVYVTFQGETQQYPMDSVKSEIHNFWATSERLRLNASVVWRTNPEKRWQFYSGVGLGFGVGFNSEVTAQRWDRNEIAQTGQMSNMPNFGFNFLDPQVVETVYQASNPFDVNFNITFGVDFQLSKRGDFLSRLHVFVDLAPNMWLTFYPDLNTKVNPGMLGSSGIRLNI